jgi:radical SAM superfamily enzyme YgiQ (UPF0313 family)
MGQIDLLLINPSIKTQMYGTLGSELAAIEPPVWIGLIAGFIRERGYSVKILDADAEGVSPEETADVIIREAPILTAIAAIGANPSASSTPKMAGAGRILNRLSERRSVTKTALFGIHPSALPEKTLREEKVDFLCQGESFYTLEKLVKALKTTGGSTSFDIRGLWHRKGGEVVSGGWGELVQDLDELPFVAWDLLPMEKYRAHNWHCFGRLSERSRYAVIYTSLGCPFDCSYCNIHALYGGKPGIRFRSIKKVAEEIDLLVERYGVKNIKILDELFVLKEDRVMEFCNLLIQRSYKLNMWAYARIDTINEKILRMAKQAGINWLCYGIETASKKVRDGVSKRGFDQDAIRKAVEMTHRAGIYVMGNFLFGLPEDTLETMRETLELAKELNCEYVNLYATMAYPGSRLYEEAARDGLRLPDSWIGYSQFSEEAIPLATKYVSGAEVLRFRDEAFYEYYSDPSYLQMIERKFGPEEVEHIKKILALKVRRKLLETGGAQTRRGIC